jgi:hypothetical protein
MLNLDSLKKIIRRNLIAPYLCKNLSKQLIPILGCQRSGTTLTFLILTAHPQIRGLDEFDSHFSFSDYSWRLLWENSRQGYFSCFKLPQKVAELNYIVRYYPFSKIIWPVRSPYATISSMKKLKMEKDSNWLESQKGSISELQRLSHLFKEIKTLDIDHLRETMPVALGAYVWQYKMLALKRYKEQSLAVYDFAFETLLESPAEILPNILNFIGAEWHDSVLNPEQFSQGRERQVYAGGTRADRPIDSSRKDPSLLLEQREIDCINSICEEGMAMYNYALK